MKVRDWFIVHCSPYPGADHETFACSTRLGAWLRVLRCRLRSGWPLVWVEQLPGAVVKTVASNNHRYRGLMPVSTVWRNGQSMLMLTNSPSAFFGNPNMPRFADYMRYAREAFARDPSRTQGLPATWQDYLATAERLADTMAEQTEVVEFTQLTARVLAEAR